MKKAFSFLVATVFAIALISSCGSDKTTHPLDMSGIDSTVNPADNFFLYANGTWLENTEIPPSKTGWGSFYIVRDRTLLRLRTVIDSVAALVNLEEGTIEQQVAALYESAMDSVAIKKAGLKPLKDILNRIEAIDNPKGVLKEVTRQYKHGSYPLFVAYVAPDTKNSRVQRVHLRQGGLGLPNRDYYFKQSSRMDKIRSAYHDYVATILKLSGSSSSSAADEAAAIIELETKLAEASKTPVELRNVEENYHLLSVKEMNKITANINWANMLSNFNIGEIDTLQVGQPGFYKQVSKLLETVPVSTWKDYLRFHLISSYAEWLSPVFAKARFEFYNRLLSGQKQPEPRWKRAGSLVNSALGDALGQLYVERYFPPEAKEYMLNLVRNLQDTYKQRIKKLDWMSDSTKKVAIEKLEAFHLKIGYPDEWEDYSSINITDSLLIQNLINIGQWQYEDMISKLGKPVDRGEWFMTPQTVNANYNPSFNEIVFPAGILQPPFYYRNGDDAVNYGATGAVIGHEMSHGFDDQGSKFDKYGNLNQWWTPDDRKRFEALTQQVVEQYNNYTVLDTVHVNGKLTLGENIGDIGGVAAAYNAFQHTEQYKKGEKINGLTPTQRFFMAYAQVWRIKNTDARLLLRIKNDPHSPEMYRVNGPLSNMKAFYEAFDVSPGDGMYRADSIRIHIW